MFLPLPARPELPPEQQGEQSVRLRYEDLSQDGRLMVTTLGPLYGMLVWGKLLREQPAAAAAMASQGVVPILSRLVMNGDGGPFTPAQVMQVRGGYDLGHSVDERGEVARLHMRIWAEAWSAEGGGGERRAGWSYAEHVFTRLFAPPEQRRVQRLDVPGLAAVPEARVEPVPLEAWLSPPPGATLLDELSAEPEPILFSLGHTDANQHVNSLVYPRVFEEAVLRRLRRHGVGSALLVRHADCGYRKPFFAGEAARALVQTFRTDEGIGALGALVPESAGPGGRPSVVVRLLLAP